MMMSYMKENIFPARFMEIAFLLFALGISPSHSTESHNENPQLLSLELAISIAQQNDPWLAGNKYAQDAIESMSIAAGALPDPKISIDMANLPTNNLSFGQEAMTQFKVGVSQSFPQGDSRRIKQQQLQLKGSKYPFQRMDHKAKIAVTVGQLWLNLFLVQESISFIEKNRVLFDQLTDLATSGYSSGLGKVRQQNILQAQLERTRLEDRITILRQRREMYHQQLAEWVSNSPNPSKIDLQSNEYLSHFSNFKLVKSLPDITMRQSQFYSLGQKTDPQKLFKAISAHPAMKLIDQRIRASQSGIDLAKQKYKPEWELRAGYGYRSTDSLGNDRSDLFSVGVTFSIPLFTANRQDKELNSAQSLTSAAKTEKWQLARKLMASFETAKAKIVHLNQRQKLYNNQLLPQINEQAKAFLTAYTNDDGNFSDVMRAQIDEIDAHINALTINVERQKTILQLNYYFTGIAHEAMTQNVQGRNKQ